MHLRSWPPRTLLACALLACVGRHEPPRIVRFPDRQQAGEASALDVLGRAIGDARIVVLAEPSHGDGAAFLRKAQILQYLHEKKGFDVVAWESGQVAMHEVDSALSTTASLEAVERLGLLSFWRGTVEVRATLQYIRESRSSTAPITVIGIDNQHTASDRLAWIDRIAGELQIDSILHSRLKAQYRDFRLSAPALDSLELSFMMAAARADSVLRISATASQLLLRRGIDDARVQVGMFRDHIKRGTSNFRVEANNPRDARMAANLIWQMDHRFRGRRVVVWLASLHAIHHPASVLDSAGRASLASFTSTGQLLRQHFGNDLYTIGFTALGGRYGSVYDSVPTRIPPLQADAIELLMAGDAAGDAFVDLRGLPRGATMRRARSGILLGYGARTAPWANQVDGIFLIREMTPVTRAQR